MRIAGWMQPHCGLQNLVFPTMPCVPIPIDQAQQLFSADPVRLYGPISKALATYTPYLSLLKTGTFPAAVSATLTTVAQGIPAPGTSLVTPTFTAMGSVIGSCGAGIDLNGTNQWTYSAGILTDMSEPIALETSFAAFAGSLVSVWNAVQLIIKEIVNADIRNNLYQASGVKAVIYSTATSISSLIAGGENQIGTPVPAILSDATLNFQTLFAMRAFMQETLRCTPFGGTNGNARFIGSIEQLEQFRNDLGAAAGTIQNNMVPLGSLAAGGNKMAVDAITGYAFEPIYRGIEFGLDPTPMRFAWSGAGYVPIEPRVQSAATRGTVSVVNPAWVNADYELSMLVFENSFERQILAPFTGEGSVRFMRQMFGGEARFINHPDMVNNLFQNYGVIAYRIGRAFRPIYPWFVLPIISKRCRLNTGLVPCVGVT